MTEVWRGQDPWSVFERHAAWDGAAEPEPAHDAPASEIDVRGTADQPHEVAFVQAAIQRVYHP